MDSSEDKGKRKASIDEEKKAKEKLVERKRSLQEIKEVTEDEISCMESGTLHFYGISKITIISNFVCELRYQ